MSFAYDTDDHRQYNLLERASPLKLRNVSISVFIDYSHQVLVELRIRNKLSYSVQPILPIVGILQIYLLN